MVAEVRTRWIRARVRTRAFFGRGGRDMTAGSTGSTPRDWAGGPSIRISVDCFSVFGEEREGKGRGRLTDPENLHGIQGVFETKNCAEQHKR